MAEIKLQNFLNRHKKIVLDTMVFIYQFEDNKKFSPLTDKIFNHLQQSKSIGFISTISLLEILIKPKSEKQFSLALQYKNLLTNSPYLHPIEVTTEIADLASSVRIKYNLPTPDSIIIATALAQKATGLITADKRISRIQEIDVHII